jgi:hypothetical protein
MFPVLPALLELDGRHSSSESWKIFAFALQ